MASLSTDGTGNRTIQFVAGDGKRRSVRLGKVTLKLAESVKLRVERLAGSAAANEPPDRETCVWVNGVGDELHAKLAAVGLVRPRESRTLGTFLKAFLTGRGGDNKPATLTNYNTVRNDLVRHFGETLPLRDIDPETAHGFKRHLQTRSPKLSAATVSRRLTTARMLFKHALALKLVDANPFAGVAARSALPPERKHYVTAADTLRLLEVCPPLWRIIIALARFGGLRNPSEVLSLKWENVNLPSGRMTVTSPKTEHIEGKGYRAVPIFATLRPYLEDAYELAEPGAVYVVPGNHRDAAQGRPAG